MINKICSVENCNNKYYVRGWCIKHYQRWRAHGDPLKTVWDIKKTCSVKDCERKMAAKGFCSMHYKRWQAHGTANAKGDRPRGMSDEETVRWFWGRKSVLDNGCWIQNEVKPGPRGYVLLKIGKVNSSLHRFSYATEYNLEIRKQLVVHHKCANRQCFNPAHLQSVTAKENTAEMLHRNAYQRKIKELEKELEQVQNMINKLQIKNLL